MPSAARYPVDINSAEARELEESARGEATTRNEWIERNWAYYYARMRDPLKKDGTGVNDNVKFPIIQNIVDKSVAAMLGNDDVGIIEGITFLVLQSDTPRYSRRSAAEFIRKAAGGADRLALAQEFVDEVWELNHKGVLLHNIFLLLTLTGHVFIKAIPDFYGEQIPRLMPLDTRMVNVFWDEGDPETPLWYRYEFGTQGRRTRQDFVRVDDMWVAYEYEEQKNRAGWAKTLEMVWNSPLQPIYEWQNLAVPQSSGQYYGRDDVSGLIDLNDSVNFIASNMQRIQKHHAHPKTIVTGAQADEIQSDINSMYAINNDQAKVYNLEMLSDMSASLNFLQAVERGVYAYGREVDPVALVQKFGDRLTNFAVRVVHGDTLGKRQVKWMSTEAGLNSINAGLLDVGGFDSDALRVDVIPPDPLPTDQFQQAETLTMDVSNLGLSQVTALERRGYDPATEIERRKLDQPKEENDGNDPGGGQQSNANNRPDAANANNRPDAND